MWTQSSIARAKTPCLQVIFILLERSQSVDVENDLGWTIRTSIAQVMHQKKGRESNWQFDSQPLKVGNRPDPGVCSWSATHLGKLLRRATSLLETSSQSQVWGRNYELLKSRGLNQDNFGSRRKTMSFGCRCHGQTQIILYGGRWWLPLSLGCGESCESRVAHALS
jgi:hypothetical protein